MIHIGRSPSSQILSSMQTNAGFVKNLRLEDHIILRILGSALTHSQSLTKQQIMNYSRLHEDIVDFRLEELRNLNLVSRHFHRFSILTAGLDTLALRILADKNVVDSLGKSIGTGKESDVYEAINDGTKLAIKFYRIGRISFRETTRKRSFALRQEDNSHHWLLVSINGAKKEVEILQRLSDTGIAVPKPLYRAMHCIVLNRINGTALVNTVRIDSPMVLLKKILNNVAMAYKRSIIHSDLSEYNVLVEPSGEPYIIDWPQAVSTNHINAKYLLTRDIASIVKYFNRKYGLCQTVADGLELVVKT